MRPEEDSPLLCVMSQARQGRSSQSTSEGTWNTEKTKLKPSFRSSTYKGTQTRPTRVTSSRRNLEAKVQESLRTGPVRTQARRLDPQGWTHREGPEPRRTKEPQGTSAPLREEPSIRSSTYKGTKTRPKRVTPLRRPWTPQNWGTLRYRSSTRASWRVHDNIEVNNPCCQANRGCITKGP